MTEQLRKLLLVGDKNADIEFISEFITDNELLGGYYYQAENAGSISVIHGNECRIIPKNNNLLIISENFPSGLELLSEFSVNGWNVSESAKICDTILFLCSYPWLTQPIVENLAPQIYQHISHSEQLHPVQYRLIFYKNNNLKFGSTDIENPDLIVRKSFETIKNTQFNPPVISEILEISMYKGSADLMQNIISTNKTMLLFGVKNNYDFTLWRDKTEAEFELFMDIDDFFILYPEEYYHEEYESLIANNTLHGITRFKNVNGSVNIAKTYIEDYKKAHIKTAYEMIIGLYKYYINDICFWDLNRDIAVLVKKADDLYDTVFSVRQVVSCPKNQADYQSLMNRTKLDIKFTSAIKKFITKDLINLVFNQIKEKEKKLSLIFTDNLQV